MKKRLDNRLDKKLMVSFSDNGFDRLGLTENISRHGMCISSNSGLMERAEIMLSIAVPGEIFTLKGEVMWCKTSEGKGAPESIGICITEAPEEYLNYVEYLKHRFVTVGVPQF